MRGKQPQQELFESPYAMTILPAKGKAARAASPAYQAHTPAERPPTPEQPPTPAQVTNGDQLERIEQMAARQLPTQAPPVAVAANAGAPATANGGPPAFAVPVASGFPPPPPGPGVGPGAQSFGPPAPAPFSQASGFAPPPPSPQFGTAANFAPQSPTGWPQAPGFAPPLAPDVSGTAQPGSGEAPHHHYAQPEGETPDGDDADPTPGRRSKRLVFLAIPLILVIGTAAYLYVPKLLHHSSSSPTVTSVVVPASVNGASKTTDATLRAATAQVQAFGRAHVPAMANLTMAMYGTMDKPVAAVGAGMLPASVNATTAAQQIAIIGKINNAPSPDGTSDPTKLAHVAFPAKPGQLFCGKDNDGPPPATDCVYVDQHAFIVTVIYGPDAAKNVQATEQIITEVEK